MNELTPCDKFIYAALTGAAGLAGIGVYGEMAPLSAAFPYIVFSCLSSPVQLGAGAVVAAMQPLYLVKVYGRADQQAFSALAPYADAADTALIGAAPQTLGSFWIGGGWRDPKGAFRRVEEHDGVRYNSLGAYYRFHLSAA